MSLGDAGHSQEQVGDWLEPLDGPVDSDLGWTQEPSRTRSGGQVREHGLTSLFIGEPIKVTTRALTSVGQSLSFSGRQITPSCPGETLGGREDIWT